jgi:tRNA nucleotidyltransferase (CCA-adding enzyme)
MPTRIRSYVRELGIDGYVVGGAVRDELLGLVERDGDEDFLVPGVDQQGLRALLEPYGRVEDMEVHGQLVGVRLHPRDPALRKLVPAGIELTPPRVERSTGPGPRDFEIVSDPNIALEEDMARRDFTINAMAIRLADGTLLDPFGGVEDLERRQLRTVSERSFEEDPLRLVRALRFVAQLDFDLAPETEAQMRKAAPTLRHVSAERIGGGVKADGQGELSKLLLGRSPERALLLARDTGVLGEVIPEFRAVIGYHLASERQPLPLEEHIFAVVQAAADAGARLEVRLACLLHDLGKPPADAAADGEEDHAGIGARIADRVLGRLRYPTRVCQHVRAIVSAHSFDVDGEIDARRARRFLAQHGDRLALDLLQHKAADLTAKNVGRDEVAALQRFTALVHEEQRQPHRLADLAVSGDDLKKIGYSEGPELGRVLRALLDDVVDEPGRNEPAWLLERAARELS